jgi:hypothetical protein
MVQGWWRIKCDQVSICQGLMFNCKKERTVIIENPSAEQRDSYFNN